MAISVKQEPLYPSITKPGVFYFDNHNESVWEQYTGIDDSEINRFKFSIGSWTELKAQNRSIMLLPNIDMDFISSGLKIESEDTATKPGSPPPGWVENTVENVEETGDVKPPRDSDDMSQRFEEMFKHPYFIAGPEGSDAHRSDRTTEGHDPDVSYVIEVREYMISAGGSSNDRGRIKERFLVPDQFGGNPNVKPEDVGWHANATSKSPELKLAVAGKGYWKADISDISTPVPDEESAGRRVLSFLRNVSPIGAGADLLNIGRGRDRIFRYKWKPNLHAFQKFNREGTYMSGFGKGWLKVLVSMVVILIG